MRTIDSMAFEVNRALTAQKEAVAEAFLIAGAMPRDLRMEIGPVKVATGDWAGGEYVLSYSQPFRMA